MAFVPNAKPIWTSDEERSMKGEVISCPECGTDFEVVTTVRSSESVEARLRRRGRRRGGEPKTVTTLKLRSEPAFCQVVHLGFPPDRTSLTELSALRKGSSRAKTKAKPYALHCRYGLGPDDRPVYGVTVKIRRAKDKKRSGRSIPITWRVLPSAFHRRVRLHPLGPI